MSEHLDHTISEFAADVQRMEADLGETKRMVNKLCVKAGRAPLYPDADKAAEASIASIRRDQWYGQAISTAIREYLAMRRSANLGPAQVNEIYDALLAGGYKFEAKDAENSKRGLRISLTKNTAIFHRLPDGKSFGLIEWYPEIKVKKDREPQQQQQDQEGDGEQDDFALETPKDEKTHRRTAEPTPRVKLLEHNGDDA